MRVGHGSANGFKFFIRHIWATLHKRLSFYSSQMSTIERDREGERQKEARNLHPFIWHTKNTQLQEQSKGPDFPRQLMWHYFTLKTEVGSLCLLPTHVKQIKPSHYMRIGWYHHLSDPLASNNPFFTQHLYCNRDYWVTQSLGFWAKRVQLSGSSREVSPTLSPLEFCPVPWPLLCFSVLSTSLLTSTATAISQAMMWLLG